MGIGTGFVNGYKRLKWVQEVGKVQDVGMTTGCRNEYRNKNGFRTLEWVQEDEMGTGCRNGFQDKERVQDIRMGTKYGNGYGICECVQEVGMGTGKCYVYMKLEQIKGIV